MFLQYISSVSDPSCLMGDSSTIETIELGDTDFNDLLDYLNSGSEIEQLEPKSNRRNISSILNSKKSRLESVVKEITGRNPIPAKKLEKSEKRNSRCNNNCLKVLTAMGLKGKSTVKGKEFSGGKCTLIANAPGKENTVAPLIAEDIIP